MEVGEDLNENIQNLLFVVQTAFDSVTTSSDRLKKLFLRGKMDNVLIFGFFV